MRRDEIRWFDGNGSCSDFWKVMVSVPTFDKLRLQFRFRLHKKQICKKILEKILPFYRINFFTGKKIISFIKFIVKCEWKMLNEGNQTHNFISGSGSGTVINYGSGSDFLTSCRVPVQLVKMLRFRFHNTASSSVYT
jgi:hypothetical protein